MTDETSERVPSPTPVPPPPPERAWDVTRFEIKVTNLWHSTISFRSGLGVGPTDEDTQRAPQLRGELHSREGQNLTALVRWDCSSLLASEGAGLHGVIVLRFAHKAGLPETGARYYCQVNAPILAYPYIREIVAHVTAGGPFGPLILEPLDVPRYVRENTAKWAAEFLKGRGNGSASAQGNHGSTTSDGPEV